jgi:hypothetical protein
MSTGSLTPQAPFACSALGGLREALCPNLQGRIKANQDKIRANQGKSGKKDWNLHVEIS